MFEISLKKLLLLQKLKILFLGNTLLMILKAKNCWNVLRKRITKHKSKRVKKGINCKKGIKCMLNRKATIVHLTAGLIKKA